MEAHGMLFCKNCSNLLYIKTQCDKENPDDKKLLYYCKNCGETHEQENQSVCVYDIEYQSDSTSNKYVDNNLLHLDPTIPHLKTITCVNPNCITNQTSPFSITFEYEHMDSSIEPTEIENILSLQIAENMPKTAKHEPVAIHLFDTSYCVILKSVPKKTSMKEMLKTMKMLNEYLQTSTRGEVVDTGEGGGGGSKEAVPVPQFVNVQDIKKNRKDVLFVKYDKKNMKFLYKCCNCFTTWKNK
jgi:DNA-directed RNA polymerase subunit M/transcription elongation factor TFIIS